MVTKVSNPLRKRFPRDLRGDLGKYLALFVLIVTVVGEICGFSVADECMQAAYRDSFSRYQVEHGNFTVDKGLNHRQWESIEQLGVRLNELFFVDVDLQGGDTLRIFKNRDDIDQACVMEGRLAESAGEIAVDRMYAHNNGLSVGSVLSDGQHTWTICGLIALSDYCMQFENNSDYMFDSTEFGVSLVAPKEFETFPQQDLTKRYAWRYDEEPADERAEKQLSDSFLQELSDVVQLESYVPRYTNQAIVYASKDMNDMKAMMTLAFYLAIAIIAFVFGVTTSSTIEGEAKAIGTLRASGYTRLELFRHYLAMPLLVTLVASLVGIVLGCTLLKGVNTSIYYDNYSLVSYETFWTPSTLIKMALMPVVIMLVVDGLLLWRRLVLSPLRFLRGELDKNMRGGAIRLNKRRAFFSRYRIRNILQNLPNYAVLLAGILFSELLLLFGLGYTDILEHYQQELPKTTMATYQYILSVPQGALEGDSHLETLVRRYDFAKSVQTANPDAEAFTAYSLRTLESGDYKGESIMVYGIAPDSRYVSLSPEPGEVYVSSAYADKMKLKAGDVITLAEQYDEHTYTFTVQGVYDYKGPLAIFMQREYANELFGYDKDMFSGYFCDSEITDIPELYIGQVLDSDSLTKMTRQLVISMGGLLRIVTVFSLLVFFILMYVVTKIVIDKNAQSISMLKILGYQNGEIGRLYLHATSMVVVFGLIVTLPIARVVLQWLYEMIVASKVKGWLGFYIEPWTYLAVVLIGLAAYALVSLFEMKRIRDIAMQDVLKNVE